MYRQTITLGVLLLLVIAWVSPALAQQVGENVFVVAEHAELRLGDQVLGGFMRGSRVLVTAVRGNWVGVSSAGHVGWLKRTDVVAPQSAVEAFSELIEQQPNDSGSYFGRGEAWVDQGNDDRALADYEQAIQLDPSLIDAHAARSTIWIRREDWNQLLVEAEAVLRIDPNDGHAYCLHGLATAMLGQHQQAIEDYDQAIRLGIGTADVYGSRGHQKLLLGSIDEAIEDYTRVIEIDCRNATAFMERGIAWEVKKVWERAILDYDEAVRLEPGMAAAYAHRGELRLVMGDAVAARQDFDEAIRLDPSAAVAWRGRACVHILSAAQDIRASAAAVSDATRACELTNWQNYRCIDTLAAAYAMSGQVQQAVGWESRAVELAPADQRPLLQQQLERYQAFLPHLGVTSRPDGSQPGSRPGSAFAKHTDRFKNPPAGFEWCEFYEGHIALLKPEGWYVTQGTHSGIKAFSISKEEVQPQAPFSTGLMINVISTESVNGEMKASELVVAVMGKFLKHVNFEVVGGSDMEIIPGSPGLQAGGLEVRFAPNSHQLFHLVADDERGLAYVFYFEAPDDQWDQEWKKTGLVIMNSLWVASP